jgi:prepilin-type N-terminal cleavage/methylation domain-containing protein
MLRSQKSGFTLIELMVVIVIIGVLASLAIPRFTEASNRAKVAEAPRVLASFESALAAAVAEVGTGNATALSDATIFQQPDSRWFTYTPNYTGAASCLAAVKGTIGPFGGSLLTTHISTATAGDRDFTRTVTGAGSTDALKWVPNFVNN